MKYGSQILFFSKKIYIFAMLNEKRKEEWIIIRF